MTRPMLPLALALLLTACAAPEPKTLNGNEVGQPLVMGRSGCERAVRKMLRDPGSLERGEYVVTAAGPTSWSASMRFGARNGFGGMNQMEAVCSYDGQMYRAQMISGQ